MESASSEPSKILWRPSNPRKTFLWQFMQNISRKRELPLETYQALHAYSIGDRRLEFWEDLLQTFPIIYEGQYSRVVDPDARIDSIPKWFEGLSLNYTENILYTASPKSPAIRTKLHKEDNKIALVEVRESQSSVRPLTWGELRKRVALYSNALKDHGVKQGDRVAAIMGNSIDTLCVCLATAALGGIYSTSSTDMGSKGILERLRQIKPKWVFMDDSYIYNGKQFVLKEKMKEIVQGMNEIEEFDSLISVPQDEQKPLSVAGLARVKTLQAFLKESHTRSEEPSFTRVPFNLGFIIVYSSGTTGPPKCIVHGVGASIISAWRENHLSRGIGPDSRVLQFTTTGWIMYLGAMQSLHVGSRLIMYDGSPFVPTMDAFLVLAGQQGVTHLGVSPRFFSTLQSAGVVPNKIPGINSLQLCTSTGMVLPPSLFRWFYSDQGFPKHTHLANISGGTDLAASFLDGNVIEPLYDVGGCQCLALGHDVRIFDSTPESEDGAVKGSEVPSNQPGDLVCVKSFPNMPVQFWGDSDGFKYRKAYFSRFDNAWTQGDFIYREPQTGAIVLLGRADGVLNPSGVRFGSAEVYTVIESKFKDEIDDTICVGQRRKGDVDETVLLFVKVREGKKFDKDLVMRIKQAIAEGLSRRHVPRFVFETKEIPTTINLKKVELPIKRIVSGERVKPSGTLANPQSLEYYYQFVDSERAARERGFVDEKQRSKRDSKL